MKNIFILLIINLLYIYCNKIELGNLKFYRKDNRMCTKGIVMINPCKDFFNNKIYCIFSDNKKPHIRHFLHYNDLVFNSTCNNHIQICSKNGYEKYFACGYGEFNNFTYSITKTTGIFTFYTILLFVIIICCCLFGHIYMKCKNGNKKEKEKEQKIDVQFNMQQDKNVIYISHLTNNQDLQFNDGIYQKL